MMRAVANALLTCACVAGFSAAAETRYISDLRHVPLRSGPSGEHRIIHWGLPSGTTLEVLEEDESAQFTRVRTDNGTEGWVPTQYLVDEPIARAALAEAQAEIERLQGLLAEDTAQSGTELVEALDEAARNSEEESAIGATALEDELEETGRVSADAIAAEEDDDAEEPGARDDLLAQAEQLARNVEIQWMLVGGGLILAGLLIGIWLGSRSRRHHSW